MTASALFPGQTWHRRYRPVGHFLRYSMLMMLIDLDEAADLDRRSHWFGYNRARILAFHDTDHGDGSDTPLRSQVELHLVAVGLPTGGPIRVLAMPRVFGQVFNPLTVYYCHPPGDGAPMAILYEVNNTFGQRHSYLLKAEHEDGRLRNGCDKQFYVSPFMDMALHYRFALRIPPAEAGAPLSIEIEVGDEDGRVLTAAFNGRRREFTENALLEAALAYPFLMLKVIGAIHWEALKLALKGMRLRHRPPAPAEPITIGTSSAGVSGSGAA